VKKIIAIIIKIFTLVFLNTSCTTTDNMCGNTIINQSISPDQKHRAIVFLRDCGATTRYSTQLSIIKNDDSLKNEIGNILIINDEKGGPIPDEDSEAEVKWESNNELIVYCDSSVKTFKRENEYKGIKITYKLFNDSINDH
jgi:hypothetical protein